MTDATDDLEDLRERAAALGIENAGRLNAATLRTRIAGTETAAAEVVAAAPLQPAEVVAEMTPAEPEPPRPVYGATGNREWRNRHGNTRRTRRGSALDLVLEASPDWSEVKGR